MHMEKYKFFTPITYRIKVETLYCHWYPGKVYYSIKRAIQAFKLMNHSKFGDNYVVWLVHFEGDKVISKQRINLN